MMIQLKLLLYGVIPDWTSCKMFLERCAIDCITYVISKHGKQCIKRRHFKWIRQRICRVAEMIYTSFSLSILSFVYSCIAGSFNTLPFAFLFCVSLRVGRGMNIIRVRERFSGCYIGNLRPMRKGRIYSRTPIQHAHLLTACYNPILFNPNQSIAQSIQLFSHLIA